MLCKYCSQLNLDDIRDNGYRILIEAPKRGSLKSGRSRSNCELCDFLLQRVLKEVHTDWIKALSDTLSILCITPPILPVSFVELRAQPVYPQGQFKASISSSVVSIEVFCSQDDPITAIINSTSLAKGLDSDECLSIASRWLLECRQQSGHGHQYCPKPEQSAMPSRVINVGSPDGSQGPYLQETKGELGHWVALSHCWGGSVPLTTTKKTFSSRKRGIKIDALPLSFQDAVYITRKLGLQHLWIDSLCIIQDSPEDWNLESGLMDQIYGRAVLCIAAEAAASSDEGIFRSSSRDRTAEVVEGRYRSPSTDLDGRIWFRKEIINQESASESRPWISTELSLGSRAWTLQENFLAPRILRFARNQIKWCCRTFQCTEDNPHFRLRSDRAKQFYQFSSGPTMSSDQQQLANQFVKDCWYRIINEFSSRSITRTSDRLPAVAGLAKEIAHRTGSRYISGLWLEDMHRGLLWSVHGTSTTTLERTAPSWSWASVSCPEMTQVYRTRFFTRYTAYDYQFETFNECNLTKQCNSKFDVRILSAGLETKSSNECLSATSATLRVAGWCYPFDDLLTASRPTFHQPGFERSKKAIGASTFCELDTKNPKIWTISDLQDRGIIYCHVAKFKTQFTHPMEQEEVLWALILESVDQTGEVYRRIGIAEISLADSLYAGWTERTISIV